MTDEDHEANAQSLADAMLQAAIKWHAENGRESLNGFYVACALGKMWCACVGALSAPLQQACLNAFKERASQKLNVVHVTQADESGPRN